MPSTQIMSELTTIAEQVTRQRPANDVVNRREHERFVVDGSLVRVHCKSFEVRGATADVTPSGMLGALYRMFSSPCEVVDLSKGGMSFETTMDLPRGKRVTVNLHVPGSDAPLTLVGEVRWQRRLPHCKYHTVGVHFAPFSKREGCNPPEALYALRQLERSHRG